MIIGTGSPQAVTITPTAGSEPDGTDLGFGATLHHELNTASKPVASVKRFVIANGHASQGTDRLSEDSIQGTYRAVATSSTTPATRMAR